MSPGVSGYQALADFCPDLTLMKSRGHGPWESLQLPRHFITHLLIVANGDFTAPPALVVSRGSAVMDGKGRPARESLQGAPVPTRLVYLDLATIWC